MRVNNNSYRTYLENQQFDELQSNNKLRVNSEYLKEKHYQSANMDDVQLNNDESFKNSAESNRYKTYEFQSIEQQEQSRLVKSPNKKSSRIITYNTQEINRNVNKVLSDIEEIESEFRKLSSQNSISMKPAKRQDLNDSSSKVKNMNANVNSKFLEQLMDKIKKPINYEQKTDDYIWKQKVQLIKLIKNLNKKLNDRLKQVQKDQRKSVIRQSIAQSKLQGRRRIKTDHVQQLQKRKSQPDEFEKSFNQVANQLNINQKLIQNMKGQLDYLNKKYEGYQRSLKNYKSTQHSVDELRQMIKMKKQEISRLRKKKFLRQKSIISIEKKNGSIFALNSTDILSTNCSTSTHSSDILSSLKEEYREHLRKKEKIKEKIEINKMHLNRIEELKEKNHVNKEHYEELVEALRKMNGIKEEGDMEDGNDDIDTRGNYNLGNRKLNESRSNKKPMTEAQQQHLEFIYKTKRSKLQMLMNTVKRNDQLYKRKYYTLLKQYQAIIDPQQVHNDVGNESPKTLSNGSYLYKAQQQQIVDEKLGKSRINIAELQNRVSRLGKVGKIIKKINHIITQSNDYAEQQQFEGNQQYDNNGNQSYSQEQYDQVTNNNQSEQKSSNNNKDRYEKNDDNDPNDNDRRLMKRYSYTSKSQTTPLGSNRQMNNFNNKNQQNQRIVSASSYLKSPHSEISQKEKYEKESSFLTQNDKSLQDLSFALQNSRLNNQEKKKYIGKFKKQRIIQKQSKRVNDFVGISEMLLLRKKSDNKKINNNNNNKNNYKNNNNNYQSFKKRMDCILEDINQPIIEQQIQATNSLQSSQYKAKGGSSPSQTDWDQKIISLIKHNQHIQEEIELQDNNKEMQQSDNYHEENEESQDGFSPEKESQLLLLGRQEQKRAQKEKQIKQKYQQILFKSKLFS